MAQLRPAQPGQEAQPRSTSSAASAPGHLRALAQTPSAINSRSRSDPNPAVVRCAVRRSGLLAETMRAAAGGSDGPARAAGDGGGGAIRRGLDLFTRRV
jgi:hypothetical protein